MAKAVSSKSPRKAKEQQQEPLTGVLPVVAVETPVNKPNLQDRNTMSENEIGSIIEYGDDLSEAEAPVPLTAGDYPAEIRGAEIKTSAKGNKYINVTFIVNADDYPADYTEGNPDGTTLSFMGVSPENNTRARYNMRKFLEAIGQPLGKSVDLNDWIGSTAIITVTHEMYEGVPQARIKKVNPA